MIAFMKPLGWLFLFAALAHGSFVPPADGPVPFRRDKLPLDTDTMAALSRQLVVLASGHHGDDAAPLRLKAQLLALALALDPANNRARDVMETLADEGVAASPSDGELQQALSRVWNIQEWLLEPEAGRDGTELGQCLGDVLSILDPEHPGAVGRGGEEKGAWKDWIPELKRYEDSTDEPEEELMADHEASGESGDEGEPPSEQVGLALKEATLAVPLWVGSYDSPGVSLRMTAVKMTAWQEGEENSDPRLRIELPGEELSRHANGLSRGVEAILTARHGKLPRGLRLHFGLPKNYVYSNSRNGVAIAMPVALLADAAISGVAPAAAVFAAFGDDGELVLPPRAWETLREIGELPASRIVMPVAASELLPALVTLDRAEVFMRHEILIAKDFDEMVSIASSEPADDQARAHEAFDEIRQARGSRSLGGFLGFDSTRQRLGQVVAAFPPHASARLLALRGTSQWPKRLDRKIYAQEIRACLLPMGLALTPGNDGLRPSRLEEAGEVCREQLAAVERYYGAVADRDELHGAAVRTAKLLGSLASDLKRQTEGFDMHRAVRPVYGQYVQTMELLTRAAGDQAHYPLPRRPE
jgi:hypothetical protein